MRIALSGSIAYDYLMSFPGKFKDHILADQIDHLSVSFLVDAMEKRRGGIAPNIAYTLALLGERPVVLGAAGQDFGEYRHWLEAKSIDTSGIIEFADLFTASFFVTTDQENNQIASFYTGAMARSRELSIAEHLHRAADLVVISPDDPVTMTRRVRECKALGIPYVYDPSQQIIRLEAGDLEDGIEGSLLLIVNEYEFGMIQEKTGWDEGVILSKTHGLIVTLGERGSRLQIGRHEYSIPTATPSQIADPTGVGDAFRGGLLRGFSLNLPWEIAGRMGSLAAAYVLEQVGTQSHHYSPAEFVARYREQFDDQGALDGLAAIATI